MSSLSSDDELLDASSPAAAAVEKKEKVPKHPLPESHHPTQYSYTFWFNRRLQGVRTQENYEKNIKKIGTFRSVEEFWAFYNHLVRPNDLPNTADYHLFKKGIKPMWEDDGNKSGGKWIVRVKKGLASRYWEDLLIAVVGEQFDVGDEVCGLVVSIRYQEDIISVWNRSCGNNAAKQKIHDTMRRVLSLPAGTVMEYKNHDASIKDNSSFRNTEQHLAGPYRPPARRERDTQRDRDRETFGNDVDSLRTSV